MEPVQEEDNSTVELDLTDEGRLREGALLAIDKILEIRADTLPLKPASHWQRLNDMLNNLSTTQSLVKEAVDHEDEQTLVVLGVLQVWVWHIAEPSTIMNWAPILKKVQQCPPAATAVADYIFSFYD